MQLIQKITVCDPGVVAGRGPDYAWWPTTSLDELAYRHQEHLRYHPGTVGLRDVDGVPPEHYAYGRHSKGVLATLSALIDVADDNKASFRLLKLAALHPLLWSSRAVGNLSYSNPACRQRIDDYAKLLRSEHEGELPWLPVHTDVLPRELKRNGYRWPEHSASDRTTPGMLADELILWLYQRVEELLQDWQVVKLEYTQSRAEAEVVLEKHRNTPQALAKAEAQRLADERHAEWQARTQQEREKAAAELLELKKRHPRYGEWNLLTLAEKKAQVWSKPMTKLAAEFGISDVAIRKQCVKAGIDVPTRGHWLRGVSKAGA